MDRRKILHTPGHFCAHARLRQLVREGFDHFFDVLFALAPSDTQLLLELGSLSGMQNAKAKVFEFRLKPVHAESVRQRHINFHGLDRDSLLGIFSKKVDRSHVVQAIGQLNEQDADVLRHRDQHFAEVFGLSFAHGRELDLRNFGQAFDEERDLFPAQTFNFFAGGKGVFEGVVEKGRGDRHVVHPHVDQDAGDFERMNEIGLAAQSLLPVVHLRGKHVGALKQLEVDIRVVFEHPVGDVIEAKHGLYQVFPRMRLAQPRAHFSF